MRIAGVFKSPRARLSIIESGDPITQRAPRRKGKGKKGREEREEAEVA